MLGDPTDGYPSLIALISFLGGIQLVSVGIVGEYVGKTYIESKQRPLYLTEEVVENKEVSSRDQISNFRGVKNDKAICPVLGTGCRIVQSLYRMTLYPRG